MEVNICPSPKSEDRPEGGPVKKEEEWRLFHATSDRRGGCPEGELLMEEEWRSLAPTAFDEEE